MKFDSYFIIARLFPGILSGMPLFVLHFFFLRPKLGEFWETLLGVRFVSDITVSLVFLIAFVLLSRYISKELFEKRIFKNGSQLPTTDWLLYSNSQYSSQYKQKVHEKVRSDFGVNIPTQVEETQDQLSSRKVIDEAVSLIRAKVGKGRLVNQHNAEYGFWRNCAGGSLLGLFLSIANVIVFSRIQLDKTGLWISAVLGFVYLLHLISAKRLIVSHGQDYAKVLIQEYMAS